MSRINLIIPLSLVESKYMSPRVHVSDLWPLRDFSQYILDILYLLAAWNNFSPRHWIELKRVAEGKTSNR